MRRHLAIIAIATACSACASTGAVPRPFPVPGGANTSNTSNPVNRSNPANPANPENPENPESPENPENPENPSTFDAYAVTTTALALRGAPYRNGGADPNGFDCSGFTQYVFAQYGVKLPREVRDQFRSGTSVKLEEVAPGDLLFFATTDPGASHVAIAIGGDEFVHAPSTTGVVRVERLRSSYWQPRFLGARRVDN